MQFQPLTLGQALAILAVEKQTIAGTGENKQTFVPTEDDYLRSLRLRLQTLESSDSVSAIWQALPERCCDAVTPFLADNEDFFLMGIFLNAGGNADEGSDTRFCKHLNDCYWCFEAFGQVMRDYHNKSQELLQSRTN